MRPDWCPHQDCKHVMRSSDVCSGVLPKKNEVGNDKRICFKGIGDMLVDNNDLSHLHRVVTVLKAVRPPPLPKPKTLETPKNGAKNATGN